MATDEFRKRMLLRPAADELDPVELDSITPSLSFTPVDLSGWKLLTASPGGRVGGPQHMLTRIYEAPPSIMILIAENDLRAAASVRFPPANATVNGRPAHLVSVVDDERHGAAALTWRTDPIMYVLRLWIDDTDEEHLNLKVHELAQEIEDRRPA